MDAQSLAQMKSALESEIVRCISQIDEFDDLKQETLSEASGENEYRDHMADQGSATFERELGLSLEENARIELQDAKDALARIEAGTYGICTRCSGEIPLERLEAMPAAKLCIGCKEAEESR